MLEITDPRTIDEARALRDNAAKLFLGTQHPTGSEQISKLVGGPNPDGSFIYSSSYTNGNNRIVLGVSVETLRLLRALNGPHGYAVYKMLLLKKNSLQES